MTVVKKTISLSYEQDEIVRTLLARMVKRQIKYCSYSMALGILIEEGNKYWHGLMDQVFEKELESR